MVALGMYFIALTLFASFLRWRGTLFQRRWLMGLFVVSVAGAMAANELGWMAAEAGRQPWVVHPRMERDSAGEFVLDSQGFVAYRRDEGLRTAAAVSESVTGGQVLSSIVMFSFVYLLLFVVWLYVLNDKIHKGPTPVAMPEHTTAEAFKAVAGERIEHEASMSEAKEVQ
jgi:cytochrome d ubiquinol oxidase subunit I